MILRIGLAVVVAVSCLSLDVSAQRRGGGRYAGITVYEDPDFRGTSVTFRDEIADLRQHGLNDRITSLELDGNQAWEVCQDVNFGGRCRVFTGTVEDLREQQGWNDRISSLRPAGVSRGRNGNVFGNRDRRGRDNWTESRLVLYDRPNYRGTARDVSSSTANLGSIGDRARSVEVEGGDWELCEGASRNARCVTVSNSVPDLRSLGFRNGITSVRESTAQGRGRGRRW
jgi:hypothetical protein